MSRAVSVQLHRIRFPRAGFFVLKRTAACYDIEESRVVALVCFDTPLTICDAGGAGRFHCNLISACAK